VRYHTLWISKDFGGNEARLKRRGVPVILGFVLFIGEIAQKQVSGSVLGAARRTALGKLELENWGEKKMNC